MILWRYRHVLLVALQAPLCLLLVGRGDPFGTAASSPLLAKLKQQAERVPVVVAHRGASADWPENTLPAFTAALDAGAQVVELDFHQTRDGVLVCLHDKTLDRTTDARAVFGGKDVAIAQRTWDEIAALDAGRWKDARFADTRIPTLEAALEAIQPRAITMIEHKAGRAKDLVELLRRRGWVESVIVQSFDWDWLAEVHALEPRLLLGALSGRPLADADLERLPKLGAAIFHQSHQESRVEDLPRLRRAVELLCVYTVDADCSLIGCAAMGIDMITTNRPRRLAELIDEHVVRRSRR
ncbi:MAG: glycerophosphodiester phosphodiesterase [Planctomycetota bacterium]